MNDITNRTNDLLSTSLSTSLSWSDITEKEIESDEILLVNKDENNINYDTPHVRYQYSINEIILKNPCNIPDIILLEYETYVTSHLYKYIKQSSPQSDSHISRDILSDDLKHNIKSQLNKFMWIQSASTYLSNKLKLRIDHHKNCFDLIKKGIIPRSSYKFCEFGYECEFNYNLKTKKGCFAQHYVHNNICSDLEGIITFIKSDIPYDNNLYMELCKSVKTIAYVVKHMYEELLNVKYRYFPNKNNDINLNLYHIEKKAILKNFSKKF